MNALSPDLHRHGDRAPLHRRTVAARVRRALGPITAAVALAASLPAAAHGPTRQKVTETIQIAAAPEVVWARIQDFAALKDWHPAVEASPADKGNEVGSVRTVRLRGGGELHETLERYSDAERKYSYRAKDGGALPVTNYTSTISVAPDGTGSLVEWRGAFYRGHPGNNPPPELNDDTAIQAITGVYKAGLENLKKIVQAR